MALHSLEFHVQRIYPLNQFLNRIQFFVLFFNHDFQGLRVLEKWGVGSGEWGLVLLCCLPQSLNRGGGGRKIVSIMFE